LFRAAKRKLIVAAENNRLYLVNFYRAWNRQWTSLATRDLRATSPSEEKLGVTTRFRALFRTIVGATRGKILTMMMRLKKTNLMRIDMLHKAETFGQGDQAKGLTLPNIDFASILFRGTRPCKAQPTYPVRAPCIVPKRPTRQMF
jgi:hypothetical protein